jgi:RHS repeat-associated protein
VGNRLTQTAPSGTTTYTYDGNNRLLTAVGGSGTTNYGYDANGNLTTTGTATFTWDALNRMSQTVGAGGTVTYTYNGDSLKIRRIGPDGTTRYYHDGIRPIWEADGVGSMTAQLDRDIFGNLLSRKEPAGTRRYYHFDGLGSTTALSDEGGVAVATLLYDAWGNQRAASGAAVPNYRFTGAELDRASGLYHMGARFYDPSVARWMSEDPQQPGAFLLGGNKVVSVQGDLTFDPRSLNSYSYVGLNPLGYLDPTGLAAEPFSVQQFLSWVRSWGISRALQIAREIRQTVAKIIEAFADAAKYSDFKVTAALGVGFTFGVEEQNGEIYVYGGGAIGFQGGWTFTLGFGSRMSEGWYIAIGGTLPFGFAFQLGRKFGCSSNCHFREYGFSLSLGIALAVFRVWRIY